MEDGEARDMMTRRGLTISAYDHPHTIKRVDPSFGTGNLALES